MAPRDRHGVLFCAFVWFLVGNASKEKPSPSGLAPYGLHGWLALFVFGSYVLAPLYRVGNLLNAFFETESQFPRLRTFNAWGAYKVTMAVVVLVTVVWQIIVARELRRHLQPRSVRWVRIFLVIAPMVGTILVAVAGACCSSCRSGTRARCRRISRPPSLRSSGWPISACPSA